MRVALTTGALSLVAFVLAGSPALAHDEAATTVQGHIEEDSVVHTPAMELQFDQHTEEVSAADAARAAARVAGTEDQVGKWGPVVDWPVVGIHAALLESGKVLAYDSVGDNPTQDHTRVTLWDPTTGSQTPVNVNLGFNIFCSGLSHLIDGSLFVAGGNKNAQADGISATHIFDSKTNTWSLGPTMAVERWYPSVTPLNNGEMLITEGGGAGVPDPPEVRKTDGTLRTLSNANLDLPLYPWMDTAPDGRAFYSGPDSTLRTLDPAGGGTWQTFGQRDSIYRDYGSHATYDVGKILVAGGGPSTKDARVIDLNGATPQVSTTAQMAYGRRQNNLTVLADGTVLATGGNSSGTPYIDMNNGVYDAELWNPATGQWKTLAAMQVTRQYHSTALLLPDGRVLSAGGGVCGVCDQVGYLAKNAEVFSPPYLFKNDGSGQLATRPQVTSAPSDVGYNQTFGVSTPDAASISKVALTRLGAVTHSVNMDQRYIPLSFTKTGGAVQATAPANANIAPPGVYMLFVIGANGVPSVAKMVKVGVGGGTDNTPPDTTIDSGPNGPTNNKTPTFDFSSNESGSTYECKVDSGSFSSCNSPKTLGSLSDGNHTFTVRATDAAGNTDPSPATRSFKVDTAPPTVSLSCPPAPAVSTTSPVRCTGTWNDPGGANASGIPFGGIIYALDTDPGAATNYTGNFYSGPFNVSGDGTFDVVLLAVDRAGNVSSFDVAKVKIDTKPPETTIDSGPNGPTTNKTPTFGFSSDEPGSTFECKLDAGSFASCDPPKTVASLADGDHTFSVRATDSTADTDPTPAVRNFTVDTTPPDTTIDSGPNGPTNNKTPTFDFSSNESGSTFECKLDTGSFASCNPPKTLAALADGSHTISVRATDAAGNTDPSPATRSFKVDTAPPTVSLSCPPAPAVSATSPVRCTGTWNDPGGSNASGIPFGGIIYALDTDPGAATNYTGNFYSGPFNVSGDGTFDVVLLAVDRAGNVSAFSVAQVRIATSGA